MMEYTHTSRAPSTTLKGACPAYSNISPAVPECQRGTLNHQKLQGAGAWDVMENIASERRIYLDLHQKPEQQVQGIITVPTQ